MGRIRKQLVRSLTRICIHSAIALLAFVSGTQGVIAKPLPARNVESVAERSAEKSAEIVPDAATPTHTTIVESSHNQFDISGGQHSSNGSNLFHNLEQFNLDAGQTASFITPSELQNVIANVTGGPSSIDGLLQVLGSQADLYLINPAGILFGPNAQLNIHGNFTAATATSLEFPDHWLNLVNPLANPNNTAAIYTNLNQSPTGFAFTTASNIVNLGDLTLGQGNTLSFLSNIVVNTGNLSVPRGNINIIAVESGDMVRFSQNEQVLSLEVPTHRLTDNTT